MIKRLNKIVAGITAAAALLLAAGCKNQLDYVDDTTAVNRMNIIGLSVKNLDKQYNGAPATLFVKEGKNTVTVAQATVAGSITRGTGADAKTLNLKSGTAFIELTKPYTYEGDKLNSSSIEMWLTVGQKTFQINNSKDYTSLENAKLKVLTSPAGTSTSNLVSRYVVVTVKDNTASYEFASTANAATKENLYELDIDAAYKGASNLADWNKTSGVKAVATEKAGTNPKYTITISGLTNDVGGQYVLCGQDIASKEDLSDKGAYWDNDSVVKAANHPKSFVQEIDKDGKITFTFYGVKPDWFGCKGPAFKIAKKGTTNKFGFDGSQWQCLIPYTGEKNTDSGNVSLPQDAIDKDITITIDATKLGSKCHFTSASPESTNVFTIRKVIYSKDSLAIGKAGYIAFCADWLPNNVWGSETPNKVKALTSGNAELNVNAKINPVVTTSVTELVSLPEDLSATMKFNVQVLNPASDKDFWADESKEVTEKILTAEEKVSDLIGKTFDLKVTSTSAVLQEVK